MGGKRRFLALVCLAVSSTALSDTVIADEPELAVELVAEGIPGPVQLVHAPGDFQRLFVVEVDGKIRIIKDGALLAEPFMDLGDLVITIGPRGLLSIAFHPQYQRNGFFYVNYTSLPDGDNVIARYQVTADPDVADPGSAQVLITIPQSNLSHNVEWIGFSPNDGYLYISAGENNVGSRAQNINSLEGKILRLDVDGDDFPADPDVNYAIPPENPLVGVEGRDEIWALGLRNPWRCSFDRETGDFYIGDVGWNTWEEVDFQPADSSGGENYGWQCLEANECTGRLPCTLDCRDAVFMPPLFEYLHPARTPTAGIGGFVYRGCAIPELQGAFIYAIRALHLGQPVWLLRNDNGTLTAVKEIQHELNSNPGLVVDSINSFGEDAYGELYICEPDGQIFKIVPATGVEPDCNGNGIADACDILGGSPDLNGNGIPDECECLSDLDGDGGVGIADLLTLLQFWGSDPGGLPDFDGDGTVGLADLLTLLGNWGPCP